jgi:hypothetical protein
MSHVSFVVVTVIVIGATFVSTRGMMAPRTMAAGTDKAVTPISAARKRWNTMTPLAWSDQNKNKNKTKMKSTTVVATSLRLGLETALPMLPLLLPLRKQSQQRRQHGHSGGSSSSRAVANGSTLF